MPLSTKIKTVFGSSFCVNFIFTPYPSENRRGTETENVACILFNSKMNWQTDEIPSTSKSPYTTIFLLCEIAF